MTTFILHGGNTSDPSPLNTQFFTEIVNHTPPTGHVLLIYFARDPKDHEVLFNQDRATMKAVGGDAITFHLARVENFLNQVTQADTIYIRGGSTNKLMTTLKRYPSFKDVAQGKTIAGSSAGAYAIAQYYYTNSEDALFDGLGLIPVKVMCHYTDEKQEIAEKFKLYKEDLELIRLSNCEYKIIMA